MFWYILIFFEEDFIHDTNYLKELDQIDLITEEQERTAALADFNEKYGNNFKVSILSCLRPRGLSHLSRRTILCTSVEFHWIW